MACWSAGYADLCGQQVFALPGTAKHIRANHDDAAERDEIVAVISADAAEVRCSKGHMFDCVYL